MPTDFKFLEEEAERHREAGTVRGCLRAATLYLRIFELSDEEDQLAFRKAKDCVEAAIRMEQGLK